MSLLDLLLVVAENARLLIFGPLLAGLVALGIAFIIPPTFTATTRILPPQQQQGAAAMLASQLGALGGLAGAAGLNIKNPADTYIALIKSRTVADRLIERFDLMQVYEAKLRQDARKALEGATKASSGKDGLITIEVDDEDPKRAADIANAYVEELHKLTGSLAITEAQQRRVFFEKQLQQSQENLKRAELALGQTGAGESLIRSAPQAMVEGIARLKAQVTAQEVRLATMRGSLTEENPQLRLAQRELASLRAQLSLAERDQPSKNAPGAEYLNRYRDFKYQETLFDLMAKQYEMARLDEAREGAVIQVVDPAVVPERKSKPKRALVAVLATLVAGFLLLLYVFMRQSLRNAESDPESSRKLGLVAAGFRRLRRGWRV
ncbi:MAG: lipopolysaccharide biosynthesis protein [Betaproteobacteria bacterium RIFCSPLOWO2_02_FULL_62_17]|nr:MAG: lipopolysaccharide biosynthesis protein [Betaproteobacteria bacterium RIFCSPLOWO2_02_FULL_62_17]